jgi:hypothetical protein
MQGCESSLVPGIVSGGISGCELCRSDPVAVNPALLYREMLLVINCKVDQGDEI